MPSIEFNSNILCKVQGSACPLQLVVWTDMQLLIMEARYVIHKMREAVPNIRAAEETQVCGLRKYTSKQYETQNVGH